MSTNQAIPQQLTLSSVGIVRNCKQSSAAKLVKRVNTQIRPPCSSSHLLLRTLELFFLKRNIFKKEEYLCSRANWTDSQETSIGLKAINWFCFCNAALNLFNYSIEFNLGPKIILNSLSPPVHHDILKRSAGGTSCFDIWDRCITQNTQQHIS